MSEKHTRMHQCLPLSRLSVDVLLALRIVFATSPAQDETLKEDMHRLVKRPNTGVPELRKIWSQYISQCIYQFAEQHDHITTPDLIENLLEEVTDVQVSHPLYQQYLPQLNQIVAEEKQQATGTSKNWRQQLVALLLPVTTLSKDISH